MNKTFIFKDGVYVEEKPRVLWEVWRDGAVWMVQGPKARVHFNSKKTAQAVADQNKALDAAKGGAQ